MRQYLIAFGATLLLAGCATLPKPAEFSLVETLSAQGYAAIPLRKLATGHESVVVSVNGREGLFILDSGAGATVVDQRWSEHFALDSDEASDTISAAGAGGQFGLSRVPVESFSLAGQSFDLDALYVGDISHAMGPLRDATQLDLHGIIGQDILTSHDAIIDVGQQRLFLKTS